MYEQPRQSYEYYLTILSVKMKVKFPCRMKIEHMGSMFTGQAAVSADDTYIFNQQIILKDDQKREYLEITFNLVTEMGSKYLAGTVKLYHSELAHSEGQILTPSLIKCIDTEARVELKVDEVVKIGLTRYNSKQGNISIPNSSGKFRQNYALDFQRSPTMKTIHNRHLNSKTQYQYAGDKQIENGPEWGTGSGFQMKVLKSPPPRIQTNPQSIYQERSSISFLQQSTLNYQDLYQRTKQKLKKQSEQLKIQISRRKALQDNQNILKLQAMRYKLKSQEQERVLNEKNKNNKETELTQRKLKDKENQVKAMLQQIENCNNNIQALENIVSITSKQLEEAKEALKKKEREDNFRNREFSIKIEEMQAELQAKERQIQYLIDSKNSSLKSKEQEAMQKRQEQQLQFKARAELQATFKSKTVQYQKTLQQQRKLFQQKIKQTLSKEEQLKRSFKAALEQKENLQQKVKELQTAVLKSEFSRKIKEQEFETMKEQHLAQRQQSQKHDQLVQQYRLLLEQKKLLEKQLERIQQNGEEQESRICKQLQDQVNFFREQQKETEERLNNKIQNINELEKQLNQYKGLYEKMKRNLEQAQLQLNDCREKEKAARKAVSSKEKQFFGAETQHATLREKIKNIDQIHQLEIDKVKADLQKVELNFESTKKRNLELQEKHKQLIIELTKTKNQLITAQQQLESQSVTILQKQKELDNLVEEFQTKWRSIQNQISYAKSNEKQMGFRLKKVELENSLKEEKIDKNKKDYKILQQKFLAQELLLRNSNAEQLRLEEQNKQLKNNIVILSSQLQEKQKKLIDSSLTTSRQNKTVEFLQEELNKIKIQAQNLNGLLQQRTKEHEQALSNLNAHRQEASKLRLKIQLLKKENQRFKEQVLEAISKNSVLILGKEKEKSQSQTKGESTLTEFLTQLNAHFKELRQFANKQKELLEQAEIQTSNIHEDKYRALDEANKHQCNLKTHIATLEGEIGKMVEERKNESLNFTTIMTEMKKKMEEGELLQQQLNHQIEELNFTVNSTKMNYEALASQNNSKLLQLKKINHELEDANQQQLRLLSSLQEKMVILQRQIEMLNINLEQYIDKSIKLQKKIGELDLSNEEYQKQHQEHKKNKKELMEKIADLEMYLADQKEENTKLAVALEGEELKGKEMKEFVSSLMKDKEANIKREAQQAEEMLELQSSLLEKTKDVELLTEQNHRLTKINEELKEQLKTLNSSSRQLVEQLQQLKAAHQKLKEKLSQKQQSIQSKDQAISVLQIKHQQTLQQHKKQICQLLEDIQLSNDQHIAELRQSQEQANVYFQELTSKINDFKKLEEKSKELEEALYQKHSKIQALQEQLHIVNKDQQSLKIKISELDEHISELSDQLKEKDQKLFDLAGKNYTLDINLQNQVENRYHELQAMEEQHINRYEALAQQCEQKIQNIEQELNFFKKELEDKDKELARKNAAFHQLQANEIDLKKNYDSRIKSLEQQKLSIAYSKNQQLHKIHEENKTLLDQLSRQQMESRKASTDLQIARRSISNLEYKNKEQEEKQNNLKKQYQIQLQMLRKKELELRNLKEKVSTRQWNSEREVKKIVQAFVRNYLEVSQNQDSNKVVELAKHLENALTEAVSPKDDK